MPTTLLSRAIGSLFLPTAALALAAMLGACASVPKPREPAPPATPDDRLAILRRSQVWAPTRIAAMDLKAGPQGPDAFELGETVTCNYVEREMNGRSPKFKCTIPGRNPDEIKVKYGRGNAEVYGEVLSTRLFWALGFGADRMYPVRVVCHGCPADIKPEQTLPSGDAVFDPAVIERRAAGEAIELRSNQGWSWKDLDRVDTEAGGAPRAHRDALKLLAVFIQHSDNKASQQRLVCLDVPAVPAAAAGTSCADPFMLIQDLGLTFGHAGLFFRTTDHVNLGRWDDTPIWTSHDGCVGNLARPYLGTMEYPGISEAGRQFLSDLLAQLSDVQIRGLFEGAQVTRRPTAPIAEWVTAFKAKRSAITNRRCSVESDAR